MPLQSVLLIAPNDDNRTMYCEYLRSRGFAITITGLTDDGLLKAAHSDIVVTGIRLARTFDGIELVRRIRDSGRTPIIVLTACAFESDRQRALAAGCDAFLTKPRLPQQLEMEIHRLLTRSTWSGEKVGKPSFEMKRTKAKLP